jgi:UDP-N-acetylmuramoyl-L-alanyl-D-glutamate--2,6-diaminopimelate ligase
MSGVDILSVSGELQIPVSGICYDSRKVIPASVFVAIRGVQQDGHQYIQEAIRKGAIAVVGEDVVACDPSVTYVRVSNSRAALAKLAVNYFSGGLQDVRLIGVTGTNGKTTTTLLLESILRSCERRVGVIGTISYRWADKKLLAPVTTPESLDLQQLFHAMRKDWVTDIIMEVSSHALALGRVAGCHFAAAIFTNLSQDHLDFHGNLANYFAAKTLLFTHHLQRNGDFAPPAAVINLDDPHGRQLSQMTRGNLWGYSAGPNGADVSVKHVEFDAEGIRAELAIPGGVLTIQSRLLGRLNLYNILAAVTAALALGVPAPDIVRGLEALAGVDGRLQRVPTNRGFEVVVDYAHTPDALEKCLECLRELTRGRLFIVFGCGGDRDRSKRPLMGKVAATLGDVVILTSDNPRSEQPEMILRDIEVGVIAAGASRMAVRGDPGKTRTHSYTVEPDRRQAIGIALSWAHSGDMVLIAGKGHETYQIIGTKVLPFDDRAVVREILGGER